MSTLNATTPPSATTSLNVGAAPASVADFEQRLKQIISSARDRKHLDAGITKLLLTRAAAVACLTARRDARGKPTVSAFECRSEALNADAVRVSLLNHADVGLQSSGVRVDTLPDQDGLIAITVPVPQGTSACAVLIDLSGGSRLDLEIATAKLVAAHVGNWQDRHAVQELESELSGTAALLELAGIITACETVGDAAVRLASHLEQHLPCSTVAVAWNDARQRPRLRAVSGVSSIDEQAEVSGKLTEVARECLSRNRPGSWPPMPGEQTHLLMAHKALARRDRCVISVTLRTTATSKPEGALILLGAREMAAQESFRRFAVTLDEPVAIALSAVDRCEGNRLTRWLRKLFAIENTRARLTTMLSLLAFALLMLVPMPYRIAAECEVVPVTRRYCVASQDGLLENTLVRPGDEVRMGDRLATLDGQEIRWQIADAVAELARVEGKRDSYRARRMTSDALQAELEAESIRANLDLLRFRQRRLTLTSPIDGVVIDGAEDDRRNVPVAKGDVVYEIAPLDQMRLEVRVPASEIGSTRVDMPITLRVEGLAGQTWNARIERIRPRSLVQDQQNVFIAEATIENTDRKLRPGVEGRSKILSGNRRLGWILFHRAWEFVRLRLPG